MGFTRGKAKHPPRPDGEKVSPLTIHKAVLGSLLDTVHSSRSSQHARSVLSAFVVLANSHFHRAVSPPARQAKELK